MKKERVLVVGGGFGGVKTALELSKDNHFNVTLLTNQPNLRYYPTLYRKATGGGRSSAWVPLSEIFADKAVTVALGSAKNLDRKAKTITTEDGTGYPYDSLVIGIGVVTNYFSIPGLEDLSYGVKSNEDALKLKHHLHDLLTMQQKPDSNYLIVGAGPTGIELAGALPAYLKQIMKSHGVKNHKVNIRLIEAAPRLLPRMPKSTSRYVKWRLRRLGVKVHLGKVVQGQTADTLLVNGKPIKSHTVIWTAGVTNHPFFTENRFVLMPRGKVATDVYLQAEEGIFILGDNANTPYSGLAQTAIYDGAFISRNLKRRARGKTMKVYKPRIPTTVIPVGKRWAVVNYRKLQVHGKLGWLLREVADFIAFKDLESWPKAARQWMEEQEEYEDCAQCAPTPRS